MDETRALLIGVVVIAFVVLTAAVTAIITDATTRDELPRCREEQVLDGFGEFGQGHWDEYTCIDLPQVVK